MDMAVAETDRSCEQLSDLRGEGAVVRWITQRDGYLEDQKLVAYLVFGGGRGWGEGSGGNRVAWRGVRIFFFFFLFLSLG